MTDNTIAVDYPQPAFPSEGYAMDGTPLNESGMSLRDYFAAKAMQRQLSSYDWNATHEDVAKWSYKMADAMMEARK